MIIEFRKFGWEKAISVAKWRKEYVVHNVTYVKHKYFTWEDTYVVEYD